jgi:cellulose synthase/poly-beta-1,6-N-acetylglucosamine synthase-like glycosyltransferase
METFASAVLWFQWLVLGYFVVLNVTYLLLVVIAAATMARRTLSDADAVNDDIFANPLTPAVSVLVPAHDEEAGIVESTRAMLGLRYPKFEVIVIDDGSTDETFARLQEAFDLIDTVPALEEDVPTLGAVRSMHVMRNGEPLVVIRKDSSGTKADALNAGLNAARHPLVCMVDADSILEADALLRVARPFVDDPRRVVATGGVVRAANGSRIYRGAVEEARQPKRWIERIQIVEYLRSFLLGRTGWSQIGGLLIVSGAFGLFRRDEVVAAGGLNHATLGEDADLVVTLHRRARELGRPHRVVYVPEPVCWTEVPTSWRVLGRQRRRWSTGLAQVVWRHRSMIGNPRYGRIGVLALPFYTAFELLGPVIELFGLAMLIVGLALGIVNIEFAILFLVVAVLWGITLSIAALTVEELSSHRYERWRDLVVAYAAAILENIGYRQIHAWWRLHGLVSAMRRRPHAWGTMTRTGFAPEPPR